MSGQNGVPLLGRAPEHVSISNSELKTYKGCRRRWWLEYYRGLKPTYRLVQGPLALGTRLHEALEHYYAFDRPLLGVYAELVDVDRLRLFDQDTFVTTETVEKFDSEAELGRIMLEGYLEWVAETGADAGYTFHTAEQKISAPIMGGKVSLIGKVDSKWVREADGAIIMRDYKSAVSFDMYHRTAMMDEQTMMYQLIEQIQAAAENPDARRTDGVVFRLLKKVKRTGRAKGPFYADFPVHHNQTTLRSYWSRLHGTVGDLLRTRQQLDQGVDHRTAAYPSPTRDCSWSCPFYKVCASFDDGSRVEAALADQFAVQDPYLRYDQTGDVST